jgi:hypothetical protein
MRLPMLELGRNMGMMASSEISPGLRNLSEQAVDAVPLGPMRW